MKRIFRFIRRPTGMIITGAAAVIAIIAVASGPADPFAKLVLATATRADITEIVTVTGRVTPAEIVDLSFEKSGKVAAINAKVGDLVGTGTVLASIESGELWATVQQYQAALEAQQIKLTELIKGSRPEEIAAAEIDLQDAEKDLANLYATIASEIISDAYDAAAYAVNRLTDELFTSDESDSPALTFTSSDSQAQTDSVFQRVLARNELIKFKSRFTTLSADRLALEAALTATQQHLAIIRTFLLRLTDAVNSAYAQNGVSISQATLTTFKTNVSTAQTNVAAALADVNTRIQAIATQKLAVQKAANALALIKAGSTAETIAAQEAAVRQAQATVDNYRAQLAKHSLRAPFSGIVTVQNLKIGQIVTANATAIALISQAAFRIEAKVPEADIAKIKLADKGSGELDAYASEKFNVLVSAIDPAETIVEGVATYKVTLEFAEKDSRIKSGMSADVDIITSQKTNVIVIPTRAVITKSGNKIVRVKSNETTIDRLVVTGIRGKDGKIEIIQGLNEGEVVAVSSE